MSPLGKVVYVALPLERIAEKYKCEVCWACCCTAARLTTVVLVAVFLPIVAACVGVAYISGENIIPITIDAPTKQTASVMIIWGMDFLVIFTLILLSFCVVW